MEMENAWENVCLRHHLSFSACRLRPRSLRHPSTASKARFKGRSTGHDKKDRLPTKNQEMSLSLETALKLKYKTKWVVSQLRLDPIKTRRKPPSLLASHTGPAPKEADLKRPPQGPTTPDPGTKRSRLKEAGPASSSNPNK